MTHPRRLPGLYRAPAAAISAIAAIIAAGCGSLEPLPDRHVVLTFDDSVKSQFTVVRPALLARGFGATFFITEGWDFSTNKRDYMTWEEIARLHQDGFEIGN
ncbi:MAG TPA: polysaccharide deacetylase family protein, partial [Planctomycetota bacterium]|nr:polysaccharide deacetylase family protein [Planctomycetota bacterium]